MCAAGWYCCWMFVILVCSSGHQAPSQSSAWQPAPIVSRLSGCLVCNLPVDTVAAVAVAAVPVASPVVAPKAAPTLPRPLANKTIKLIPISQSPEFKRQSSDVRAAESSELFFWNHARSVAVQLFKLM